PRARIRSDPSSSPHPRRRLHPEARAASRAAFCRLRNFVTPLSFRLQTSMPNCKNEPNCPLVIENNQTINCECDCERPRPGRSQSAEIFYLVYIHTVSGNRSTRNLVCARYTEIGS